MSSSKRQTTAPPGAQTLGWLTEKANEVPEVKKVKLRSNIAFGTSAALTAAAAAVGAAMLSDAMTTTTVANIGNVNIHDVAQSAQHVVHANQDLTIAMVVLISAALLALLVSAHQDHKASQLMSNMDVAKLKQTAGDNEEPQVTPTAPSIN